MHFVGFALALDCVSAMAPFFTLHKFSSVNLILRNYATLLNSREQSATPLLREVVVVVVAQSHELQ
jgi:hypothetical protein